MFKTESKAGPDGRSHPLDGPDTSKWSRSSSIVTVSSSSGNKKIGGTSKSALRSESSIVEAVSHFEYSKEVVRVFDLKETADGGVERSRQFYTAISRSHYLDKDDYDNYLDALLYDRLLNEVQHPVAKVGETSKYRSQEVVRSFWEEMRAELKHDADEESLPVEEQEQNGGSVKEEVDMAVHEPQKRNRPLIPRHNMPRDQLTADGKDPWLLEVREYLVKRQLERREGVEAREARFSGTK